MKNDKLQENLILALQNKLSEKKTMKTEDDKEYYSRDAAQMIDDLRSIAEDIINWVDMADTNSDITILNIGHNLDKYADIIQGLYFKTGPLADKIENNYMQKDTKSDEEDLTKILVNKLDI